MKLKKLITLTLAGSLATGASLLAEERPVDPEEIRNLVDDFRSTQEELVQERRNLAEELRDMDEEARRDAMRELIEGQEQRMAEQRELGKRIRDYVKENHPERPEVEGTHEEAGQPGDTPPETPSPEGRPAWSEEIEDLNEAFHAARNELLEEIGGLDPEERKAALDELREQRQQIRDAARELRDERRRNAED